MKIADLYIRVSTDEQADKGYSQRDQEERLRRYCQINGIQVRKIIYEDHSAKTFNRPAWVKLLMEYKKMKGKVDLVLFTKWDRFSRNAGDAYQMISTLRRFGMEPQAVEQPLDLSIPENKMMLAFYLAAPEVENDRRALNTFYGMRRAKKEGRWMGTAPMGYVNKISENGKKYIDIVPKDAAIMEWAFKTIANGILSTDQVRQEAGRRGLKCSRSSFWIAVRNPVYYGKIFIPKHQEEEAHLVQGQHAPIISETLFYKVQDILSDNKRKERPHTTITCNENLPLRGFLACPRCGKMITGSGSKGLYSVYYYYHCNSKCGFRHRADDANHLFERELRKYIPHAAIADLSKEILIQRYRTHFKQQQSGGKQLMEEIEQLNKKMSKARELLLAEAIDGGDYKEIKNECEAKIRRLEADLTEQKSNCTANYMNQLVNQSLTTLTNLDTLYKNAGTIEKREVISSIYPEKIVFDGTDYRTSRVNEVASCIYMINNNLKQIKNRKSEDFFHLSGRVARTRIELVSRV